MKLQIGGFSVAIKKEKRICKYGKKGTDKFVEAVEKSAELDRDHEFYLVVRDFSARHCHFFFG